MKTLLKILLLLFSIHSYSQDNSSTIDKTPIIKKINFGLTTGIGGVNRSILPLPTLKIFNATIKGTIPINFVSFSIDYEVYCFHRKKGQTFDNKKIYVSIGYSDEVNCNYVGMSVDGWSYETRSYLLTGLRLYTKGIFNFSFGLGCAYFDKVVADFESFETDFPRTFGWKPYGELTIGLFILKNYKKNITTS
jgi:hypothetical protein